MAAIALVSLMPALTQALRGPSSAAWVEICTALGARQVNLAGDDAPARLPASTHLFEHCPYCSLQTEALGLPPAAVVIAPTALAFEAPFVLLAVSHTQAAWRTALPRGPPAVS